MPQYTVLLSDDEMQELNGLIRKGGKRCYIKHAQILLKLD